MQNLHWGDIAEGIIIGLSVVAGGGILGYFGWAWKRSIYGRMDLYRDDLQKQISTNKTDFNTALGLLTEMLKAETAKITLSITNMYSRKQDERVCDALRLGCSGKMIEKMHSIEEKVDEAREHFDSQIETVFENHKEMIERVDRVLLQLADHHESRK